MNRTQIIQEIAKWLKECNIEDLSKVYVGIAKDPEDRLFNGHNVSKDEGAWIYCPADSSSIARETERFFLDNGATGGPGGGDDETVFVYAYRITSTTIEG